jgi:hypothetical protein
LQVGFKSDGEFLFVASMKIICGAIMTTVVALTAGCLLNGCAHDKKDAVYQPIEPAHSTPETQMGVTSSNAPLSYQWFSAHDGTAGATYSVTNVGGTNGVLLYQWYKNTNDNQGTQP